MMLVKVKSAPALNSQKSRSGEQHPEKHHDRPRENTKIVDDEAGNRKRPEHGEGHKAEVPLSFKYDAPYDWCSISLGPRKGVESSRCATDTHGVSGTSRDSSALVAQLVAQLVVAHILAQFVADLVAEPVESTEVSPLLVHQYKISSLSYS